MICPAEPAAIAVDPRATFVQAPRAGAQPPEAA
jgi:hypothetical protein